MLPPEPRRADRRIERLSGDASCPKFRGWTLLVGFVLAVPAGAALLVRATRRAHAAPTAIYVAGLLALYGIGWMYHLLHWSPAVRAWLRRVDHAVIYLFIAATYTPVVVVGLHDAVGYWLLALTWGGALLGATAKLIRFEGSRVIGATMYIVVGWLAIFGVHDFVTKLGVVDTILMYGGGIVYTAGAAMLAARRPDPFPEVFGYHEVWHTMVLVASVLHYVLIWRVVG